MSKPRLLDLFCGAGGAAAGYARAGFDVVGVDLAPQKRYPFAFIQADAMACPLDGFDVIHASPPCQEYSDTRHFRGIATSPTYEKPMLVEAVYERLRASGLPWVIENVPGAPMPDAIELCGSMFGLPLRRHRLFASSHLFFAPGPCAHPAGYYNVIGGSVKGYGAFASATRYTEKDGRIRKRESKPGKAAGQRALGIEWMTIAEMSQAIPPVFTQWIGDQLMVALAYEGGRG